MEGERIRKLFIDGVIQKGILHDDSILKNIVVHSSKSIGPRYELIYTPGNLIELPEWESTAKAIRKKAEELAEYFLR